MANTIKIKQGEAKPLNFHIARNGNDVDDCTLTFQVRDEENDNALILEKVHSDFDDSDKANGNYVLPLEVDDTKDIEANTYVAELKTVITTDTLVDKSYDIIFVVERAVIPDA